MISILKQMDPRVKPEDQQRWNSSPRMKIS